MHIIRAGKEQRSLYGVRRRTKALWMFATLHDSSTTGPLLRGIDGKVEISAVQTASFSVNNIIKKRTTQLHWMVSGTQWASWRPAEVCVPNSDLSENTCGQPTPLKLRSQTAHTTMGQILEKYWCNGKYFAFETASWTADSSLPNINWTFVFAIEYRHRSLSQKKW